MATWAMRKRYEWITATLDNGESFRRNDLVQAFTITKTTASATIAEYRALHPGVLRYDAHRKAFVRYSPLQRGSNPLAMSLPRAPQAYDLGQGTQYVLHTGHVTTQWDDGRESTAWRRDNRENRLQAQEQGYSPTPEGVWASLVEHEALHTLVSRVVYHQPHSAVLRVAAGDPQAHCPLWQRLHEESIVLALQLYLNTRQCTKPLDPWLPWLAPYAQGFRETLGVWPPAPDPNAPTPPTPAQAYALPKPRPMTKPATTPHPQASHNACEDARNVQPLGGR